MQTMFTWLSENGDILNDLQKVPPLSNKVQNPIMSQIKITTPGVLWSGSIQHSGIWIYFQQYRGIGHKSRRPPPPPPKESKMSTLVARKHQRAASREQVLQYSPGFYPNWSIGRREAIIYLTRGSNAQFIWQEKNIAGLHPSIPRINRLRRSNARSHLWKTSVRTLNKRGAQAWKRMKLRTMRSDSLVDTKERISKIGLPESLGVSCSIG